MERCFGGSDVFGQWHYAFKGTVQNEKKSLQGEGKETKRWGMNLDKAQIHAIANLARLKLSESEAEMLTRELNQYLDWIDRLQNIDTENVEPLASVSQHPAPMRKDEVTEGGEVEKILKNAPNAKNNFFTVPKVVE